MCIIYVAYIQLHLDSIFTSGKMYTRKHVLKFFFLNKPYSCLSTDNTRFNRKCAHCAISSQCIVSYLLTCTEDERLNMSKCDNSLDRVCRGLKRNKRISRSALSTTYHQPHDTLQLLHRGVVSGGKVFGDVHRTEAFFTPVYDGYSCLFRRLTQHAYSAADSIRVQ